MHKTVDMNWKIVDIIVNLSFVIFVGFLELQIEA